MSQPPILPPEAEYVVSRLTDAGFQAYAVGGCVRDTLLGRTPHDWDVCTSAPMERTAELFPRCVPTGARFGTLTVLTPFGGVEVTAFRRDGEYRDFRRPDYVEFTGSLREDLARRDFTVNAMAMDASGLITDPFGGRRDLTLRLIRCVGDPERRFSEDALRMLRAVRFAAQLGFSIEGGTLAALLDLSGLAAKVSAERAGGEVALTLASPRPELVGSMIEYGLLARFISKNSKKIPWERLSAVPVELRWPVFGLMCRIYGLTPSAGELLRALRAPSRAARDGAAAEAVWSGGLTPGNIAAALSLTPPEPVLIAAGAMGFYDTAQAEAAAHRYVTRAELAVSGRDLSDLGLRGPEISSALRSLALAVTAGELENRRDALLDAARPTGRT